MMNKVTPISRKVVPEIFALKISGQCWILKRISTTNTKIPRVIKINEVTLSPFIGFIFKVIAW
jgi:hypothetical protein